MKRASLSFLFCFLICGIAKSLDHGTVEQLEKENEDNGKAFQAMFTKQQQAAVKALQRIDPSTIQLYLYSIDPMNRQRIVHDAPNVFYGFPILGKVEIKPIEEKEKLLKVFIEGVKESDGTEAECFNPRHGLRLIQGGKKTDFVICYECLQVEANDFGSVKEFLTSGSPVGVFNQFLDRYHIKKAEVN